MVETRQSRLRSRSDLSEWSAGQISPRVGRYEDRMTGATVAATETQTADNTVETTEKETSQRIGNESAAQSESEEELLTSRDNPANTSSSKLTSNSNTDAPKPPQDKKSNNNSRSKRMPAYKSSFRSTASNLNRPSGSSGLEALRKEALQAELQQTIQSAQVSMSLKHPPEKRKTLDHAGDGWFGMRPSPMTEELKKDMALVRNRNYLDPKRFYKSSDPTSKFIQVGTVIEGASEFYSSRLTKKQQRTNLVEEVMADPSTARYAQDKYRKMQQEKTAIALKRKRGRKWKR